MTLDSLNTGPFSGSHLCGMAFKTFHDPAQPTSPSSALSTLPPPRPPFQTSSGFLNVSGWLSLPRLCMCHPHHPVTATSTSTFFLSDLLLPVLPQVQVGVPVLRSLPMFLPHHSSLWFLFTCMLLVGHEVHRDGDHGLREYLPTA